MLWQAQQQSPPPVSAAVTESPRAFAVKGCYAPITCNGRGACLADSSSPPAASPSPSSGNAPSGTTPPPPEAGSEPKGNLTSTRPREHDGWLPHAAASAGVRGRGRGRDPAATGRPDRRQVKVNVIDVPPDETGGRCLCQRSFYGLACQKTALVRNSQTVEISAANADEEIIVGLGGGEGLTIAGGSIDPASLPIQLSADILDELSLPPDMLPSSADNFVPAGSFADFRPDGLEVSSRPDAA